MVSKFFEGVKGEVSLIVYGSREMYEFAKKIEEISGKVRVEYVDDVEPELEIPAIAFKDVKIFFHAIPEHMELEAFLTAIKMVSTEEKMSFEPCCRVITFVSVFCPNCRMSVDSFNRLAVKSRISHHIVDATMFEDLAEKYEVRSVPTTIIGDFKIVGAVNEKQAVEWLERTEKRDFFDYFAEKLLAGDIEEVKKQVFEKPELAEVLAELMSHREFMVRLGAMAAIESLWNRNPEIVKSAKEVIRGLLSHEDVRIREDAAMMLGIIGDVRDVEFLREAAEEGGRVSDSANEAIKKIVGKEGKEDG
jgi:thiol-disulfide isomerase/thioredoxin